MRAIQLILDPSLFDEDRYLTEKDFYDGLDDVRESNNFREIILEIIGFEHNNAIIVELSDATVDSSFPALRLTYSYEPSATGQDYEYVIFQGTRLEIHFNHMHR